jgi:hypothetical protein
MAPEKTPAENLNISTSYMDVIAERSFDFNGIIFYPAADGDYTLEIHGVFYTPWFQDDNDETYWSSQHPEILMMSAQYFNEVFMRNTEGQKDWLEGITALLDGIDKDRIEQSTIGIDHMEG